MEDLWERINEFVNGLPEWATYAGIFGAALVLITVLYKKIVD